MSLKVIYGAYSKYNTPYETDNLMDNAKFTKFVRDFQLMDRNLTRTDIEQIFAVCKTTPSERKIDFDTFEQKALTQISIKKGITVDELTNQLIQMCPHVIKFNDDQKNSDPAAPTFEDEMSRNGDISHLMTPELYQLYTNAFKKICTQTIEKGILLELLDSRTFLLLCQDCKFICDKLSITGVDIIFTKIKNQGERKINFIQFQRGCLLIAEKLHHDMGVNSAIEQIVQTIVTTTQQYKLNNNNNNNNNTNNSKPSIYDKLTDASKYTGAHKNRFASDGKGLGKVGRTQDTAGVSDLSQVTRGNLNRGNLTLK